MRLMPSRRTPLGPAPHQPITTFTQPGNQWYLPALAGPSTLRDVTVGARAIRNVLPVLRKLGRDPYMDFVIDFYETGLQRFGDGWVYADINTVLSGLSRTLQPASYLEIGVRRGRSMAVVAEAAPDCQCTGFDLWIENYAGMANPGEAHVRSELARVGHRGDARFIAGNSALTVPAYLDAHPDAWFDIVTVDGDHSVKGAAADIRHVLPRLKVGGAIVFDDVSNQDHPGLSAVWHDLVGSDPRFASYVFDEVGFGVAFAIRKH